MYSVETKKVPLLGKIAAGEPIFAEEEHGAYVEAGTNLNADFCLKVQGDSMINARINDGDIVFIHKQPVVENGEIAAVIIDNEPAKVFVSENEDLEILDTAYAEEQYAIAVSKENEELLKGINEALAKLSADGTVQKIIDKYISAE